MLKGKKLSATEKFYERKKKECKELLAKDKQIISLPTAPDAVRTLYVDPESLQKLLSVSLKQSDLSEKDISGLVERQECAVTYFEGIQRVMTKI